MIDLGKWAAEEYGVPEETKEEPENPSSNSP
jgi:endogenous inhibitor of DNA gyrase (YacG/DUF329 family)